MERDFGQAARTTESYTLQSHQYINQSLCGNLITLEKNYAKVALRTNTQMSVDEFELVHGGFVFAAANFAAVAAVNHPFAVLSGARTSFLAPVKVGDEIIFEAKSKYNDARKREIFVVGFVNEIKIFEGSFDTVIMDKHILKANMKKIGAYNEKEYVGA